MPGGAPPERTVLEALSTTVVILVACIPIAMQIVSTTVMAVGSRALAEKKAIVARLSAIEELAAEALPRRRMPQRGSALAAASARAGSEQELEQELAAAEASEVERRESWRLAEQLKAERAEKAELAERAEAAEAATRAAEAAREAAEQQAADVRAAAAQAAAEAVASAKRTAGEQLAKQQVRPPARCPFLCDTPQ